VNAQAGPAALSPGDISARRLPPRDHIQPGGAPRRTVPAGAPPGRRRGAGHGSRRPGRGEGLPPGTEP